MAFHKLHIALLIIIITWCPLFVLYLYSRHSYFIAVSHDSFQSGPFLAASNLSSMNYLDIPIERNPPSASYFEKPMIRILSWNARHSGNPNHPWIKIGSISANHKCDFKEAFDCVYTNNRTTYTESQVVLFNFHLINTSDLPGSRSPDHVWIAYYLDSVTRLKPAIHKMRHLFKATATYMSNADIQDPYGTKLEFRNAFDTSSVAFDNMVESLKEKVRNKSKLVAWFVSNCRTPSARMVYAKELSKHISVDIFGGCGNQSCPRDGFTPCDRMLDRQYKFYLSFENSLCDDYVTEKFFRIQRYVVISIVLGAVDYTKFTEPETYIDVRKFDSPRHLAEYLNHLDRHPDLYLGYLLQKRRLVGVRQEAFPCALCRYAHRPDRGLKQIDLHQVWNKSGQCIEAELFYSNIANFTGYELR